MKLAILKNSLSPLQQENIQTLLKDTELLLLHLVTDCLCIKEPFLLLDSQKESYDFTLQHHIPFLGFGFHLPCPYLIDDISALSDSYLRLVYARFYHLPFVLFQSEEITLREYKVSEWEQVKNLYLLFADNKSVIPFSKDESTAMEQFSSRILEYRYTNHGFYGIFNDKQDLIGQIGITDYEDGFELSYMLHPDFQGNGIAFFLCQQVLVYAKNELGMDSLSIRIDSSNLPSMKLARKLQDVGIIDICINTF